MIVLAVALLRCQRLETRPFCHGSPKIPPKTNFLTKLCFEKTPATITPLLHLEKKIASHSSDRNLGSFPVPPARNFVLHRNVSNEAAACQEIVQLVSSPRDPPCSGSRSAHLNSLGLKLAYSDPPLQDAAAPDGLCQHSSVPKQPLEPPAEAISTYLEEPLAPLPPPISLICKCCEREYYQHVDECRICNSRYFYTLKEYSQMLIREEQAIERERTKLKGWSARFFLLLVFYFGGFS